MRETEWTEFLIQQRLIWFLQSMVYIVPNMRTWMFEMDLFFVRPSGYSEEIEVKVTLADFRADKKKRYKHDLYKKAFQGEEFAQKKILPNRFSYGVPECLGITVEDVPEYAGLYLVIGERPSDNGGVIRKKWPPFLHKKKRDCDRKIAKSTSSRLLEAQGYYKQ